METSVFRPKNNTKKIIVVLIIVWIIVPSVMIKNIIMLDWIAIGFGLGVVLPLSFVAFLLIKMQSTIYAEISDNALTLASGNSKRSIPLNRVSAFEKRNVRSGPGGHILFSYFVTLDGKESFRLFYEDSYVNEEELVRLISERTGKELQVIEQ